MGIAELVLPASMLAGQGRPESILLILGEPWDGGPLRTQQQP